MFLLAGFRCTQDLCRETACKCLVRKTYTTCLFFFSSVSQKFEGVSHSTTEPPCQSPLHRIATAGKKLNFAIQQNWIETRQLWLNVTINKVTCFSVILTRHIGMFIFSFLGRRRSAFKITAKDELLTCTSCHCY